VVVIDQSDACLQSLPGYPGFVNPGVTGVLKTPKLTPRFSLWSWINLIQIYPSFQTPGNSQSVTVSSVLGGQ